MQDLDNIVNGQKLFLKPEYQEVLKNKKSRPPVSDLAGVR